LGGTLSIYSVPDGLAYIPGTIVSVSSVSNSSYIFVGSVTSYGSGSLNIGSISYIVGSWPTTDNFNINLSGPAGNPATATGPTGAVQYTDGTGNFVSDPNFTYSPDLLCLTGPTGFTTITSGSFTTTNFSNASNASISYTGFASFDGTANFMSIGYAGITFPGTGATITDIYGSTGAAFQVLSAGPGGGSVQWGNSVACGLAVIPSANVGSAVYYIPTPVGAIIDANAVISATIQTPDVVNEILYAMPYLGSNNLWYIAVEFTANVATAGTTIAWVVHAPTSTPVDISASAP
jgi:hypothetical protein